jgi:mono/diheme cytochrome c family protein
MDDCRQADGRNPGSMRTGRRTLCTLSVVAALGLALAGSYAQTPATVARGKDIAVRACAGCHAIDGRPGGTVMSADVPSFRTLAARPDRTPESLQAYIMTPRHPMPAIPLELDEIRDVVDYIRSLK